MSAGEEARAPRSRLSWLRPFGVRVLINTLTILILLGIGSLIRLPGQNTEGRYVLDVPLVEITGASALDFVLLGLALALVAMFVRPVLTALSGSLVVRTYGLMVLFINVIVFWLAVELVSWLTHIDFAVPDPRLLWGLVVATLFSGTLLVVNTLLGLNRPHLKDVGDDQVLWRLLDGLPLSRRNRLVENLRLQQVREIVFEYGLDISLANRGLGRFRNVGDRLLGREPDDLASLDTPAKVRVMLQQLGPTYVKVGQMISSRADVLPERWRVELARLQSDAQPFPYPQVESVVRSELGATPDQLFAEVEPEPLGAASLA